MHSLLKSKDFYLLHKQYWGNCKIFLMKKYIKSHYFNKWILSTISQVKMHSFFSHSGDKSLCPWKTKNFLHCLIIIESSIVIEQAFHKPLTLIPQRADRMETTNTENQANWSLGSQPCLTQWNYETCCVGPPKTDNSWWRVLTKHGPLEKNANHFSILALKTRCTVQKGKKIRHRKITEAGDIDKRWQEYTEELYKKDLHDPDNHDGVLTHLSQTS